MLFAPVGVQTRLSWVTELVVKAAMTITAEMETEFITWNLASLEIWIAWSVGYRDGVKIAVKDVIKEKRAERSIIL